MVRCKMAKMKAAKHSVAALEFRCPVCDQNIPARDGSFLWVSYPLPEVLFCNGCQLWLNVSNKARKIK